MNDQLLQRILEILEDARNKVYRTANTEMLQAYWNVGRVIVEEEQKSQDRASMDEHCFDPKAMLTIPLLIQ